MIEAVVILIAGIWAGTINTVVGSGTLITFPVLIGFGYAPLTANISNNLGLVPGGLSGTWGYRRELAGQRKILRTLAPMSLLGSLTGAVLLLWLPESAFNAIVPALIALALLLVVVQPRIQAAMKRRRQRRPAGVTDGTAHGMVLRCGVLGAGVYGGYFGAAQGVLLLGLLGSLLPEDLQRVNAVKNLLGTLVNIVAAAVFAAVAWDRIDWGVAALIAVGSVAGGVLGARVGRRLSPPVLRVVIVVVGSFAIVRILMP